MSRRAAGAIARRAVVRGWALALAVGASACGGARAAAPAHGGGEVAPAPDARTPFQRRRDAACAQLGPKLAECAVEDSRAQLAAGAITQADFDAATAPAVRRALADDWVRTCSEGYMSSRQVRVLEVCYREETACDALEACLRHLDAGAK